MSLEVQSTLNRRSLQKMLRFLICIYLCILLVQCVPSHREKRAPDQGERTVLGNLGIIFKSKLEELKNKLFGFQLTSSTITTVTTTTSTTASTTTLTTTTNSAATTTTTTVSACTTSKSNNTTGATPFSITTTPKRH